MFVGDGVISLCLRFGIVEVELDVLLSKCLFYFSFGGLLWLVTLEGFDPIEV